MVIDKPAGLTSHDVVARLRRLLGCRKIGHTGTLDPFATGVLPIAVGEGTKAIQFLDEATKEYQATMRLGAATDTQDLTGKTIAENDWSLITEDKIREVFAGFTGRMTQIPPMFSALKSGGVPLYKLARKGETIERQGRLIEIESLVIDSIELPDITFTIHCSRGTYVRTVASDLGDLLGTGAHLRALRRVASGSFSLAAAVTLDLLAGLPSEKVSDLIVPVRVALAQLRELHLTQGGAVNVANGKSPLSHDFVSLPVDVSAGEFVKLMLSGELVAVCEGVSAEERNSGRFLRTVRVFNLLSPLQ
jgi:tRNA pseudouridine55 synthase